METVTESKALARKLDRQNRHRAHSMRSDITTRR
jgi:hypothetical protein